MSAAVLQRVLAAIERIAPSSFASSWDNTGLLLRPPFVRSSSSATPRLLLTIDLTPSVLAEAVNDPRIIAIMAYHPLIFQPIKRLDAELEWKDKVLMECVQHGIAIYSPHTALDSCKGGGLFLDLYAFDMVYSK